MSGAISDKWINYADLWTPDKDTFQGVIKAIIKSVSTQKKQHPALVEGNKLGF